MSILAPGRVHSVLRKEQVARPSGGAGDRQVVVAGRPH